MWDLVSGACLAMVYHDYPITSICVYINNFVAHTIVVGDDHGNILFFDLIRSADE